MNETFINSNVLASMTFTDDGIIFGGGVPRIQKTFFPYSCIQSIRITAFSEGVEFYAQGERYVIFPKGSGKGVNYKERLKNAVDYAKEQMKCCALPPEPQILGGKLAGEHRIKCRTCGKVFCYTDRDVKNSVLNAASSSVSSIFSIANAVAGSAYHAYEGSKMADRSSNRVIDYSKCQYCGSMDIYETDEEETSNDNITSTANSNSVADELKKFKELLDNGVLTQEEFDAKKKQLLGL